MNIHCHPLGLEARLLWCLTGGCATRELKLIVILVTFYHWLCNTFHLQGGIVNCRAKQELKSSTWNHFWSYTKAVSDNKAFLLGSTCNFERRWHPLTSITSFTVHSTLASNAYAQDWKYYYLSSFWVCIQSITGERCGQITNHRRETFNSGLYSKCTKRAIISGNQMSPFSCFRCVRARQLRCFIP